MCVSMLNCQKFMLGESWIDVECQNLYVFGEGQIDFETIKWVGNFANDT